MNILKTYAVSRGENAFKYFITPLLCTFDIVTDQRAVAVYKQKIMHHIENSNSKPII
jgi:hypothetical protein